MVIVCAVNLIILTVVNSLPINLNSSSEDVIPTTAVIPPEIVIISLFNKLTEKLASLNISN